MRVEELPARLWRRRHLRILASRRRRRDAAEMKAVRRQPVHPAHERWLRYRAVGGGCRPYVVIIDDPPRAAATMPAHMRAAVERWYADVERRAAGSFTRGPAATVILIDDEVAYAAEPDPPWVFPETQP